MSKTAALSRPKSSVPGQYLGYGLQPIRLCHYLLQVPPGSFVSLEDLDDIAVHYPGGEVLLEQTKSATVKNPIADKSIELWKAFANWSTLCSDEHISVSSTHFRVLVVPLKIGGIVHEMHSAVTDAQADAILVKLKKRINLKNALVGCNPYLTKFFNGGDITCREIIKRFNLISEADPVESIREMIRLAIPDEAVDDFCSAAIGRAKEDVEKRIRAREKPLVDAAAFRRQWRAFVAKNNLTNLLLSTTATPAPSRISDLLAQSPMFVRQLEAIDISADAMLSAVSDYLRTDADRIKWAADGVIVDASFDELNDSLKRQYVLVRDEVADMHGTLVAPARGRHIYRRCLAVHVHLEGLTLPDHFVPGTFNSMANALRVGWHPDYLSLFPED